MDGKSPKLAAAKELEKQKKPLQNSKKTAEDDSQIDWKTRKRIFSFFLYVVIFTNFDTGVIPACVDKIEAEMDISSLGIAALGSLPFFAISLASVSVSHVIKKFGSKMTLFVSLASNVIVCVIFAISYNLWLLYIARFLMGFTQAFWVIYAPVWTNYSSPIKQQSTWLGTLQGFSPLGIILGYMATGIVIENWDATYAWRAVIILQAVCEIPVLFMLFFIKNQDIDILDLGKGPASSAETLDHEAAVNEANNELEQSNNMFKHYKVLLKNGVYLCTVSSVTVAFFVVFGIQFWSTTYIIDVFGVDATSAMIIYASLCITSPIAGVFFGGYISDKMGGYKGGNMINSLKLCMAFSIASLFVGIPTCFVYNVYFWGPLIWTQIFFGAANIPGATGVIVNSVPKEYQTSASAFAQMLYNMLAYFASPLFSGFIMDLFSDKMDGMLWGYRANEFVSFLNIFFCGLSLYFCHKENLKNPKKEKEKNSERLSVNTGFRQRAWSII